MVLSMCHGKNPFPPWQTTSLPTNEEHFYAPGAPPTGNTQFEEWYGNLYFTGTRYAPGTASDRVR